MALQWGSIATNIEELREITRQRKAEIRGEALGGTGSSGGGSSSGGEIINYPSPLDPEVAALLASGRAKTVNEARTILGYERAGYTIYKESTSESLTGEQLIGLKPDNKAVVQSGQPVKQSATTFKTKPAYGEQPKNPFVMRNPSMAVNLGNEVSEPTLKQLVSEMNLKENEYALGVDQSGNFNLLLYNDVSYDPSRLRSRYSSLLSEEVTRSSTRNLFAETTVSKGLTEDPMTRVYAVLGLELLSPERQAQIVAFLSPQLKDFGFRNIFIAGRGAVSGYSPYEIASEIEQSTKVSLMQDADTFGVTDRTTGEFFSLDTGRRIIDYIRSTATGQMAEAILLGEGLGMVTSNIGLPIVISGFDKFASVAERVPIGKKTIELIEKIAGKIAEHPDIVTKGFYGIGAGVEALNYRTMTEHGISPVDALTQSSVNIIKMVGFGEGFGEGMTRNLPLKYVYMRYGTDTIEGLSLELKNRAYPLIMRTPEGFSIGTPRLRPETIERIFGERIRSEEGLIPSTPTETRIAVENLGEDFAQLDRNLIARSVALRERTVGTQSKFIEEELPFKQVFERHGLSPRSQKDILNLLDEYDYAVFGSSSQMAQMKGFPVREVHDIDIRVKSPQEFSDDIIDILERNEPRGAFVQEGLGITGTKTGHLFDIKPMDRAMSDMFDTSVPTSGVPDILRGKFVYYGFEQEEFILIGKSKTTTLSEQATRKMGSSLGLHEEGIGPAAHRFKDPADYLAVENVLIESKGGVSKQSNKALLDEVTMMWNEKISGLPTAQRNDFYETARKLGLKFEDDVIIAKLASNARTGIPSIVLPSDVLRFFLIDFESPSSNMLTSEFSASPSRISRYSESVSRFLSPSDFGISTSPYPSRNVRSSVISKISPDFYPSRLSVPSSIDLISPSVSIYESPSSPAVPSPSLPFYPEDVIEPPTDTVLDMFGPSKDTFKRISKRSSKRETEYMPDIGSAFMGNIEKRAKRVLDKLTFSGIERRGVLV